MGTRKRDISTLGDGNCENDDSLIDSYRLFTLLRQTADSVYKAREAELKKYHLSPEQAAALVCIQSLDNQATPAELSRWLFRKRNSITILLKRMEKLGLINKRVNKNRKNSVKIGLTEKGYEAYKNSIKFQAFYNIIDVLPDKKQKQLCSLLQAVRLKVFKELRLDVDAHSGIFNRPLALSPETSDSNRAALGHPSHHA